MNENEIYSAVADVLTDKPNSIVIPVRWVPEAIPYKRTLWEKISRKPIPALPTTELYRQFDIYPCVVANMYRIIGRAVSLPGELLEGELTETVMPFIPEHLPNIVYIIGAAIQNNHLEPDPELLLFIERNFNNRQIFEALYASVEGLGLQDFMNSIVLAKGTIKIMKPKTSPKDGSELIASRTAA